MERRHGLFRERHPRPLDQRPQVISDALQGLRLDFKEFRGMGDVVALNGPLECRKNGLRVRRVENHFVGLEGKQLLVKLAPLLLLRDEASLIEQKKQLLLFALRERN